MSGGVVYVENHQQEMEHVHSKILALQKFEKLTTRSARLIGLAGAVKFANFPIRFYKDSLRRSFVMQFSRIFSLRPFSCRQYWLAVR